jgi:hypothetical protein
MNNLAFFKLSHYLVSVMILFTIAALITGVIRYKRHRNLRIFTWYIAFSLVQDMAAWYAFPQRPDQNFRVSVLHVTNVAFIVFEFTVCNLFILHYIGSRLRRHIIVFSGLLFLGLLIVFTAIYFPNFDEQRYVAPECVLLTLSGLFYFYELFLRMNLRPPKDQPAFWVVTGILFVNACDLPLFLTVRFMKSYYDEVYSLNYVLYIVFFAFLMKAFLLAPEAEDLKIVKTNQ